MFPPLITIPVLADPAIRHHSDASHTWQKIPRAAILPHRQGWTDAAKLSRIWNSPRVLPFQMSRGGRGKFARGCLNASPARVGCRRITARGCTSRCSTGSRSVRTGPYCSIAAETRHEPGDFHQNPESTILQRWGLVARSRSDGRHWGCWCSNPGFPRASTPPHDGAHTCLARRMEDRVGHNARPTAVRGLGLPDLLGEEGGRMTAAWPETVTHPHPTHRGPP